MKTSLQNIADLECLSAVSEKSDTVVVMLHGYGASMQDLFPLWEMWNKENLDWYFPNGPMKLPMGYYDGRAWFSIDIEKLEKAMREGVPRDLEGTIPPEFDQTILKLKNFILKLKEKYKKIIIGGFSQGAMCSSHLALMDELKIDGLILLSGSLIAESKFPARPHVIPFYQSHGELDPILPLDGARKLNLKLQGLGFKGEIDLFRGGHEIPLKVIEEVKSFLSRF